MATATKKSRATRHVTLRAAFEAEPAAMTFLVSGDNGGCCRWTLLGPDDDGPAHDDPDAERWLDDGGSFNREAVTRWPAEH